MKAFLDYLCELKRTKYKIKSYKDSFILVFPSGCSWVEPAEIFFDRRYNYKFKCSSYKYKGIAKEIYDSIFIEELTRRWRFL